MNMNVGSTVYWHTNQVIIRVKYTAPQTVVVGPLDIVKSASNLGVDLSIHHSLLLHSPADDIISDDRHDDVVFCQINANMSPDMPSMEGTGGGMSDDQTLAVIKKLDNGKALQKELQKQYPVDEIDVLPHWFKAGTDYIIQGCPISPPIPVEEYTPSGRWKLTFPQLPGTLQDATGKGVTVFVLDTAPLSEQILRAADQAGSRNMLLQEMTQAMRPQDPANGVLPSLKFHYQELSEVVEGTPPARVVTGKDIYGRHVGFPMEDHGLFVAGIVHDLASEATIEVIRVLNDDGVGDIKTLGVALQDIQKRMKTDLHGTPLVINLSLVVLPPEDDIPDGVTPLILEQSRDLLSSLIHPLASNGVMFVAAAGNDSDPRMNASEKRFGPRYPAALAQDHDYPVTTMISVGAVNRYRDAAMYSNHPGSYGIATYGGDIPKPDPWLPSAMSHVGVHLDITEPIDALCGLFSASHYPALSKNGQQSEEPTANTNAWAYWSGTSFAVPIISALAARILQTRESKSIDARQVILNAATDETLWTSVDNTDVPGPLIMAVQEWLPEDDISSPS